MNTTEPKTIALEEVLKMIELPMKPLGRVDRCEIGNFDVIADGYGAPAFYSTPNHAAYLTHAANVLPECVEASRKLLDRIRLWQKGVAEGVEVVSLANELEEALANAERVKV